MNSFLYEVLVHSIFGLIAGLIIVNYILHDIKRRYYLIPKNPYINIRSNEEVSDGEKRSKQKGN